MIVVISFTDDGKILGDKIAQELKGDHLHSKEYKGNIREYIGDHWTDIDSIIFVSSTGIGVRYIKDYIQSKDVDPGVIVVDDQGINVISLLSGHLGGANELTLKIGEITGARPIITTSTDLRNIEAVDMFSKNNGYAIEDIGDIVKISSRMLRGEKIGFYSEYSPVIDYKNIVKIDDLNDIREVDSIIIVSNRSIQVPSIDSIILRPKNLVVGVGARKGKPKDEIYSALVEELDRLGRSIKSIKLVTSVEAKRNEVGIIELAKELDVPYKIYSNEEISKVHEKFSKSQFVYDTIGVYNVSESAAYLSSDRLLSEKSKYNGITISIGEIDE